MWKRIISFLIGCIIGIPVALYAHGCQLDRQAEFEKSLHEPVVYTINYHKPPAMMPVTQTVATICAGQIKDEAYAELSENGVQIPWSVYVECNEAAKQYQICPELLMAMCWQETRCRPELSNGGCKGICQVNPKWHADRMNKLGVTDIYDEQGNILVACDYLSELFQDDEDAAVVLMEYNGDSKAHEDGYISDYAENILKVSAALERVHGK